MSRASRVVIDGRAVGAGAPAFVIAEAGVNHNGDLDLALRLVDAAADAGADAVKFQTFRTDAFVSRGAPKALYQQETTGADESQLEMLRRLELTEAQHRVLQAHARARGLVFLSTPFDDASADLLDALGVPAFKVPSGEIVNVPFLKTLAAKGRPMIVSTGMSTLAEVTRAVETIAGAGGPPVVLLHCVSAYPAPAAETNLRAMDSLRAAFGCPVGLSDHTVGTAVAIAAVARGAAMIEKHVTLDRTLPGPDHRASLEPSELRELMQSIRLVESALGDGDKRPMPCEVNTRDVARKSVVAARAIKAGEVITEDAIALKRPGTGISPADLPRVLGRTVRRPIAADELVPWDALEDR